MMTPPDPLLVPVPAPPGAPPPLLPSPGWSWWRVSAVTARRAGLDVMNAPVPAFLLVASAGAPPSTAATRNPIPVPPMLPAELDAVPPQPGWWDLPRRPGDPPPATICRGLGCGVSRHRLRRSFRRAPGCFHGDVATVGSVRSSVTRSRPWTRYHRHRPRRLHRSSP